MPIYEFHCGECDQDSEILVRSADWKGATCPHCGATKLTKQFSVFAASAPASGPRAAPACMTKPKGCGCGRGGPHRH